MSTRLAYLLGFITICALLSTSVYLQIFQGIIPCPLCTLQRLSFALIGILFLIGTLLHRKRLGRIFINSLSLLTAGLGLFFSGRQIWLQHFPSADNSECGVSIQYMMQAFPLQEVIAKIFTGSAECTQRGFEFLYMNMAEWAFVWFAGFIILAIYLLKKDVCTK